jgi:enoyl-CoA hydratase/carnithine racemase
MAPREAAVVARAVGDATAREMLLLAGVLPAHEMKQRGFLHDAVPDGDVVRTCDEAARRIAALSPEAARLNKQTLRALAAQVSELDTSGAYAYADGREHREGIAAFLAKRPPQF